MSVLVVARPRKIHRVKSHPTPYEHVLYRIKGFEIRKNDRDYRVNDYLVIDEWSPQTKRYTGGEPLARVITYISEEGAYGLLQGHVVLSVDTLKPELEKVILDLAPERA